MVCHSLWERDFESSILSTPTSLLAHSEMVITTDFDSGISGSSQDGPALYKVNSCMRTYEFITEALSLTKYEPDIAEAIKHALLSAVGGVILDPVVVDLLGDDSSDQDLFAHMFKKELGSTFAAKLSKDLPKLTTRLVGKRLVKTVRFGKMQGTVHGTAGIQSITLNKRYVEILSTLITNNFVDHVMDIWPESKRSAAVAHMIKSAESDKKLSLALLEKTTRWVDSMTSTLIHELVHMAQDQRQPHANGNTEYRSYLDAHKDEFSDLHNATKGKVALSPPQQARFNQLYFASPQEITAFAHEAAVTVIRQYGLNRIKSKDDLSVITSIHAQDIVDAINDRTDSIFSNPSTPKEKMIHNRYLKLAYREVYNYLEHLRSKFATELT